MSKLNIVIKFDIENDKFNIDSEVNSPGIKEMVGNIIGSHIGAGVDNSVPIKRDVYTISISWDVSDDSFTLNSDTGNKGLTDGILLHLLKVL